MKQLTLLLALCAFLAVGCAGETDVETPPADDELVEDEGVIEEDTVTMDPEAELDAAVDSLGAAVEEVQEAAGDVEEAAEEAATELDGDGQIGRAACRERG